MSSHLAPHVTFVLQARPGAGGEGDGNSFADGMHPSSSDHALPVLPEDGEQPIHTFVHTLSYSHRPFTLAGEEPPPDLGTHETRGRRTSRPVT